MKKLALVSAGLLMAASLPAMAVTATSAPFIGGTVGYGSQEIPGSATDGGVTSTSSKRGGLAWGGIAGYNYALTSNWLVGVELGYNQDAKSSYQFSAGTVYVTTTDYDLLATGTYLFSNGFNLFGKAGVARVTQKETDSVDTASDNVKQTKPIAKLGAGYLVDLGNAGSMNVFAEYAHIFAQNQRDGGSDTAVASTNTVSVGVTYNIPV